MTVNDADFTSFASGVAAELLGAERVIELTAPVMGAEDFSYVLQRVPGAMLFLGARAEGGERLPAALEPHGARRVGVRGGRRAARGGRAPLSRERRASNGPLSPRAARVLYNVADALAPPGASAVDVAPGVEQALRHRGVPAARRAWLLLMCIEWQPIAALHARRGFSWLPRAQRARLLERWERAGSAFAAVRSPSCAAGIEAARAGAGAQSSDA